MEIRALSEWNTNISIAHAQRYHIYFCNFIFTFTFIGLTCLLLYKTLMTGVVTLSDITSPKPRRRGLPKFSTASFPWPDTDTGCWRRIRAMLRRSGGSIPIFSHRPKNIIGRQKGEWRKCSAVVWWLPGLDDGWIGGGGGGEEVASLIVTRVGGGW